MGGLWGAGRFPSALCPQAWECIIFFPFLDVGSRLVSFSSEKYAWTRGSHGLPFYELKWSPTPERNW